MNVKNTPQAKSLKSAKRLLHFVLISQLLWVMGCSKKIIPVMKKTDDTEIETPIKKIETESKLFFRVEDFPGGIKPLGQPSYEEKLPKIPLDGNKLEEMLYKHLQELGIGFEQRIYELPDKNIKKSYSVLFEIPLNGGLVKGIIQIEIIDGKLKKISIDEDRNKTLPDGTIERLIQIDEFNETMRSIGPNKIPLIKEKENF